MQACLLGRRQGVGVLSHGGVRGAGGGGFTERHREGVV